MKNRPITIITITRGRPSLLRRAIKSVKDQIFNGEIQHLIIVDACTRTQDFLVKNFKRSPQLEWILFERGSQDVSGPNRLARLRNIAVHSSKYEMIAFLDDDNVFECNHLSSLAYLARDTGIPAVYSYRQLLYANGEPFLEHRSPWRRDIKASRERYKELCKVGVFKLGSNIMYDRADSLKHPNPIRTVDTNEWLFNGSLLLHLPFVESYTHNDWVENNTEDKKLVQQIIRQEIPTSCTQLPTLKYYLGGYSNTFEACDPEHRWISPTT